MEEIYCIPREAEEAAAMLEEADADPSALLDAFEVLTRLEYTSAVAAETMGRDRAKVGDVENVQRHFDQVHRVRVRAWGSKGWNQGSGYRGSR